MNSCAIVILLFPRFELETVVMITEIQELTDQYLVWLRDKTNLRPAGDKWVEITTPYLDRHNDCIQIYARRSNGGFFLTDDGATIEDLELGGCKLDSSKRQGLLKTTLNGFGVELNQKALQVRTSSKDFALKKHNLLQAMLAVNDLFYLASPLVASLFLENIEAWLRIADIRFVSNVKLSGKSGFDHLYNFVIPGSSIYPERVLLGINHPDRANAQRVVFAWEDTKEARAGNSRAYVLLNDSEKPVSDNVLTAFTNYGVSPVPWSTRENVREELAA